MLKKKKKLQDYQLGHTKVFLKDEQELFLEQERDRILAKKILVLQVSAPSLNIFLPFIIGDIQAAIRGWYCRKRFLAQRKAAVTIQNCWRSYRARREYLVLKRGIQRTQAIIRLLSKSNSFLTC